MGLHIGDALRQFAAVTDFGRSVTAAQDQHARLEQEMADERTKAQMNDIINRATLQTMGRPVTLGTIQEQMNAPDPNSGIAGEDLPDQTVHYARKPAADRLVKYQDRTGKEHQYELYTPEEQIQRQSGLAAQQQLQDALNKANAEYQTRRAMLSLPGNSAPLPDDVADALGIERGQRVLRTELPGLVDKARELQMKNRVKLGPGETEVDLGQPGAPPTAPTAGATGAPVAAPAPDANSITLQNSPFATAGQPAPAQMPTNNPFARPGAPPPAPLTTENPFATPGSYPAGHIPTEQPAAGAQPSAATAAQPGGARVLATGGPLKPEGEFERDFLPAYALKLGKTPNNLTADERIKAFSDFTVAKQDPAMRAVALALKQAQENNQPTKDDAKAIADMIHSKQMAPSQLSLVGGFGPAGQALKRMVLTDLAGRGDNLQEMEGEYQLAKSPGFQQNIRYMDQVTNSLPRLVNAANQLGNTSMRAINKLVNAGKNQFNNVDLKAFKTDVTFVADEVGKILQGGGTGSGTSDAKLRQAAEVFSSSDSPAAIAAAAKEVHALIGARRQALTRGTYLEQKGSSAPAATHRFNPATGKIEAIQP